MVTLESQNPANSIPLDDPILNRLVELFLDADESQRAAILTVAETIVSKRQERNDTATGKHSKYNP
ncbi:MAG: hypothetical protein SGI77_08970 [Pirellulaceae bacterium]|nr:hypothetical protein [Pirellulaceae bacterium]